MSSLNLSARVSAGAVLHQPHPIAPPKVAIRTRTPPLLSRRPRPLRPPDTYPSASRITPALSYFLHPAEDPMKPPSHAPKDDRASSRTSTLPRPYVLLSSDTPRSSPVSARKGTAQLLPPCLTRTTDAPGEPKASVVLWFRTWRIDKLLALRYQGPRNRVCSRIKERESAVQSS